jgi:hypothetical protein
VSPHAPAQEPAAVPVPNRGDGLLQLPHTGTVVAEAWPAAASRRVLSATGS